MTKLEEKLIELELKEKLIELGYEDVCGIGDIWRKGNIQIITFYGNIQNYCVFISNNIHKQQDIDDLQQAFNVLQNDLEKLRQIESKENLKECIKALNDDF